MIPSSVVLVAGSGNRELLMTDVYRLALTVQAVLRHGVLFNEVSLHAHVEDGAERTKGSIHRVMFRLMTGVSYTSNAVPRPPQLLAESAKIFDVDAGKKMRHGAFEVHHSTVVFVKTATRSAANVARARFRR